MKTKGNKGKQNKNIPPQRHITNLSPSLLTHPHKKKQRNKEKRRKKSNGRRAKEEIKLDKSRGEPRAMEWLGARDERGGE